MLEVTFHESRLFAQGGVLREAGFSTAAPRVVGSKLCTAGNACHKLPAEVWPLRAGTLLAADWRNIRKWATGSLASGRWPGGTGHADQVDCS